jgi:type VI secretion system secreted protein Hcp
MSMPVHMTIDGQNQGTITSACCQMEGREDTVILYQLNHMIEQPRDKHTGRATGKRVHNPFVLLKEIDKATPLLMQALVTNELLTVKFEFYRPNPEGDGTEEQFYMIELEGANLISFAGELPNTLGKESSAYPPLESLELAYRKIIVTYQTDGVSAEDDWHAPV